MSVMSSLFPVGDCFTITNSKIEIYTVQLSQYTAVYSSDSTQPCTVTWWYSISRNGTSPMLSLHYSTANSIMYAVNCENTRLYFIWMQMWH